MLYSTHIAEELHHLLFSSFSFLHLRTLTTRCLLRTIPALLAWLACT